MDITQTCATQLVDNIGMTLGLQRHTDAMGCSYYATSNDTVVRIADHSTHLQTWVDNGSYSKKNLYSIVIEVTPSKPILIVNQNAHFIVKEYKHKLKKLLSPNGYLQLINGIKGAVGNGGQFSNPFGVTSKILSATYQEQKTNSEQPNNESKQINNMNTKKKAIKLTESTLKRLIKESVKKVLHEEYDDDFGVAYDSKGNEIHEGDIVIWKDPETGHRTKYEVYGQPDAEMVHLWNRYGECEAFPEECTVIKCKQ